MNAQHKYAEILRAIADGEKIQVSRPSPTGAAEWRDAADADEALQRVLTASRQITGPAEYEFRIKPKTILVNGSEISEPFRKKPRQGQTFWIASPDRPQLAYELQWSRENKQFGILLKRGLVHLSSIDASTHAAAMIIPSRDVK